MTDEQAVELLRLLDTYAQLPDLPSLRTMTVVELAGDLLDSLPRLMQPDNLAAVLYSDALTARRD